MAQNCQLLDDHPFFFELLAWTHLSNQPVSRKHTWKRLIRCLLGHTNQQHDPRIYTDTGRNHVSFRELYIRIFIFYFFHFFWNILCQKSPHNSAITQRHFPSLFTGSQQPCFSRTMDYTVEPKYINPCRATRYLMALLMLSKSITSSMGDLLAGNSLLSIDCFSGGYTIWFLI